MPLRGRRRRSPDKMDPNLTPLLDVVLQLITFFMMLIHFGSRLEGGTKAIRLPVAPAALPGSDLAIDRMLVELDARGRLLVEGTALEGVAAESWWTEQARRRRSGQEILNSTVEELPTVVVLRADRDASYGSVRRALTLAQDRGFSHFSLVVLRSKPR